MDGLSALHVAVICAAMPERDTGQNQILDLLARDPRFALKYLIVGPTVQADLSPLVNLWMRFERRVFPLPKPLPTAAFDAIAPDCPVHPAETLVKSKPLSDTAPDLAPDLATDLTTDLAVDVVIDMLGGPEAGAAMPYARHGVWRLSTVAPEAGLAEAFAAAPETLVTLTQHRADARPKVIAATSYAPKFLATRTQAFIREKSVQLIERELARLRLGSRATPASSGDGPAPSPPPGAALLPGYGLRVLREMANRLRDTVRAKLGGRPRRFALRIAPGDPLSFDPAEGTTLDAPAGQYWADPFLHEGPSGTHLFFEVLDYKTQRGHIATGRIEDGVFQFLGTVRTPDHHLSYPFVFDYEGQTYMLPETNETGQLELWRAADFPMEWTLETTALEGVRCADTALVQHDGQWWIFTNICRDSFGDFSSELHIFRTDSPMMNVVEPHHMNPVVVGSRIARGAGRLFEKDGALYRPSQDNSHGVYGYGLNIMRIERLTLDEYVETPVRHITPDDAPAIIGCHHIDLAGGRVVFDICLA